jgi:hypothetical protein
MRRPREGLSTRLSAPARVNRMRPSSTKRPARERVLKNRARHSQTSARQWPASGLAHEAAFTAVGFLRRGFFRLSGGSVSLARAANGESGRTVTFGSGR